MILICPRNRGMNGTLEKFLSTMLGIGFLWKWLPTIYGHLINLIMHGRRPPMLFLNFGQYHWPELYAGLSVLVLMVESNAFLLAIVKFQRWNWTSRSITLRLILPIDAPKVVRQINTLETTAIPADHLPWWPFSTLHSFFCNYSLATSAARSSQSWRVNHAG